MTETPEHRRTMGATGTAPFVGHAADERHAERSRTLESPDRHGPLRTGRFTVELDGVEVDGFSVVDLPDRYSVPRDGGPGGQSRFGLLELERELRGGDTLLHDWRTAVEEGRTDEGRKPIVVTLQDETGGTVLRWRFADGWPTAHRLPTLGGATDDGMGPVATESVSVAVDGIERLVDTGPAETPQPTDDSAVFRFVRTANGGPVENGAVVTTAGSVGVDRLTLASLDRPASADGERVGLLVPEGVRGAGDAPALWLLAGSDLDRSAARVGERAAERLYWVPAPAFFHDQAWGSGEASDGPAVERSIPGWPTGDRSDSRVLLDTGGRSLEGVLGVAAGSDAAAGVQSAAAGDPVDPATTVFAAVAPATAPSDSPAVSVTGDGPQGVSALFDAGAPAPLAGATFGLATVSTPDATIAGQSVNPLVGMDTAGLLEHEIARQVLRRAGVTDAETVEWLDGPRSAGTDASTAVRMLGTDTTLRSYRGVVSGRDGPWAVAVHVARITDDSHVVAAGVHRRPLGTAGGFATTTGWERTVARGRAFTARTVGRLEYL